MERNPEQIPENDEVFEEEAFEQETSVEAEQPEAKGKPDTKKLPLIETRFSEVDVTSDERTMAALAHGSIILTLLTGGVGGLIVAFVIWAVHRDKSPWVADQSLQALIFQIATTLVAYVLGVLAAISVAVSGALTAILIGLCMLPFALIFGVVALIFPLAATAYGLFGALETYQGRDFEYWWVSNLVRERA